MLDREALRLRPSITGVACCTATEIFLTFAKVYPFLAELRAAAGEPDFYRHMTEVVLAAPQAGAIMAPGRRAATLAAARARAAAPPPVAG